MNHDTYFSFVCYDIKKPAIKNIDTLFLNGFLFELNKLKLITPEQETLLKTHFNGVFLHSSINNRNIIGNMNSHIQLLDFIKYEFEDMQDYFKTETLNKIPLKQLNYLYPYEAMQTKINQLFKGHLKIT